MNEFEIRYQKLYNRKTEHLRFHGTNCFFDKIDLKFSKGYRDFGPGFYLAESYNHAEGRALQLPNIGCCFVYVYAVPKTFNVISKDNFKRFYTPSISWLDFIMENRKYKQLVHNYEVVIGPTADANVITLIDRYNRGKFGIVGSLNAKQALIAELKPYRYSNQTCLCSENVINQIRRIDCISIY